MPRYSYVIAFPVLIALCVGINIQRYPAVSAMLRGESVESRWLGRSEIFDFQNKKSSETHSYQGYRSDSDNASDSRASREPIPLSGSHPSAANPSEGLKSASPSDRYTGSYDNSSYGGGSTGPSTASPSDRYSSSYGGNSYDRGSYGDSDASSMSKKDRYGLYDDKDRNMYDAGDYDAVEDDSSDVEIIPSRITGSGNRDGGMTGSPTGNRDSTDMNNNRSSWPEYSGSGSIGNTFRADSPAPGYSSRYSAGETATSVGAATTSPETPTTAAPAGTTASAAETEPKTPRTARPLSLQEKLELRLATPFSLTPTGPENASSGQYIPPDFLPAHENGVVGKLVDPSAEPAISIKPVAFGSPSASGTGASSVETSPEKPEASASADSSKE